MNAFARKHLLIRFIHYRENTSVRETGGLGKKNVILIVVVLTTERGFIPRKGSYYRQLTTNALAVVKAHVQSKKQREMNGE